MTPREQQIVDALTERPRDTRALALTVLGRHDAAAVANMRVVLRRLESARLVMRWRDDEDGPYTWAALAGDPPMPVLGERNRT